MGRQQGGDHQAGLDEHVALVEFAARRTRPGKPLGRRREQLDALLVVAHAHVLDHNRRVETLWYRHARVGEFPIAAAHPGTRVGKTAIELREIIPVDGHRIEVARERIRHIQLRYDILGQNATYGLLDGHLLDIGRKLACAEDQLNGLLLRYLDVMRMVPHVRSP